jgi:chemotaxis protein MotB
MLRSQWLQMHPTKPSWTLSVAERRVSGNRGRSPHEVPTMMLHRVASTLTLATLFVGCVTQDRFDEVVRDGQQAQAQLGQCDRDMSSARADLAHLNDAIGQAQSLAERQKAALADATGAATELQTKLDNAIAMNAQLKRELERLGKNADALLAERGGLASGLRDAKARMEELRKAQAAAAARAQLYKDVLAKFHKMIDAGQLRIALRSGRMVIQLANDVLFDSGHTEIKPAGQLALAEVAGVFRTIPGRNFQVAGDTDNVPIHTERFTSNWELSTARAVEVVRYLVAQSVRPDVLSAAGYGEFDPITRNEDPEGRSRNRRIEIKLQPNIDELVALPQP